MRDLLQCVHGCCVYDLYILYSYSQWEHLCLQRYCADVCECFFLFLCGLFYLPAPLRDLRGQRDGSELFGVQRRVLPGKRRVYCLHCQLQHMHRYYFMFNLHWELYFQRHQLRLQLYCRLHLLGGYLRALHPVDSQLRHMRHLPLPYLCPLQGPLLQRHAHRHLLHRLSSRLHQLHRPGYLHRLLDWL